MAAFSILAHDAEVPTNSVEAPTASTAGNRPGSGTQTISELRLSDSGTADDALLPGVVLQLPDLAASLQSRPIARFRYASQIYWVTIALGALLAVWLILTGKKPVERTMDDAPAWSSQSQAAQTTQSLDVTDAASTESAGTPVLRTARLGDPTWNVPGPTVQPGEAAPLGISTPVQQ